MQFLMDQRHQLIECRFVPVAPLDEELRNLVFRGLSHLKNQLIH